jgi:hypothetical protein
MKKLISSLMLILLVNLSHAETISSQERKIIDQWNNKIFNMHDPLLYNAFFGEIQKTASDSNHKDHQVIKLYAELTKVVQTLEGLTWREEPFLAQSDFVYSMWVSSMRGMYAPDYLTSKHMRKFGRYLTEPHMKADRFYKISEFQDHLLENVIPALEGLSKQLGVLSKLTNFEFTADQYVYRGYIPAEHTDDKKEWFFVEERDRYQKVLPGHFGMYKSYVDGVIGALYFFGAYNFDGVHKLVDALVSKATKNAILKKLLFRDFPSPLAIVDRMEEMKKSKYKHLFTLRDKTKSKQYLKKSLEALSRAAEFELSSYISILKNAKDGEHYIMDTDLLKVRKSRKLEEYRERVQIYKAAQSGESYKLNAPSTRYVFDINPQRLFEIEDFKTLLPKEYFKGKKQVRVWEVDKKPAKHPIVKGTLHAWDFNYGKPVKYMDATFNGFMPSGTDKNYLQLIKSLRMTASTKNLVKILPVH